jgi:hypothetical protein
MDTEKDLGWRVKGPRSALAPGMVAARHFNNVQIEGDYVIKTAATSVLRGEIFFYEHMPHDIAHLFPALVSAFCADARPPTPSSPSGGAPSSAAASAASAASAAAAGGELLAGVTSALSLADTPHSAAAAPSDRVEDGRASEVVAAASSSSSPPPPPPASTEEGVSSMTLQRVKGVTFSHLVTNRSLTPGRLTLLLRALHRLHTSKGDPESCRHPEELPLCANYLPKVRKRFMSHGAVYRHLSEGSTQMFGTIEEELSKYESERRYQPAAVIHGDPVFSNVLLTDDGRIFLLDMRGELGTTLTLQGDLTYDLSKVYQSLLGYDYIILGQPLYERDAELLEELRHTFRAFVRDNYPSVRLSDIVKITASHYFGIVPLHVNRDHQAAYLQTAAALLSSLAALEGAADGDPQSVD